MIEVPAIREKGLLMFYSYMGIEKNLLTLLLLVKKVLRTLTPMVDRISFLSAPAISEKAITKLDSRKASTK